MTRIVDRIARELPGELLELLSSRLSASELSSLLLEVAARRASRRSPAELVRQYAEDRFVRPSRADPRVLNTIERLAFESAPEYEPITLAPLAPLGTCSVVATASQNKIVSTMRNTEVVSDATNLLALECARRRVADPSGPPVRLCAAQRTTRAQALARPEHSAHFHLFVTVLAGRDPGGRELEVRGLEEAIGAQLALLDRLRAERFAIGGARVVISPDEKHRDPADRARERLRARFPLVDIAIDGARLEASNYYRGVCFSVLVEKNDDSTLVFPVGDGGLTDWVAKLTANRKERYLVGAIGTELFATVLAPS